MEVLAVVLGALISIAVTQANEFWRLRREDKRNADQRRRAQLTALEDAERELFATLQYAKVMREGTEEDKARLAIFLAQLNVDLSTDAVGDLELQTLVTQMMNAFQDTAAASNVDFADQIRSLRDAVGAVRKRIGVLRDPRSDG